MLTTSTSSLCAFIVQSSKPGGARDPSAGALMTLVDLGPVEKISDAVREWRASLGVASGNRGLSVKSGSDAAAGSRATGQRLRELVFDPLLPALGGPQHVILALDHILQLVPLDALQMEDGVLVGDRFRIETRATLTELVRAHPRPQSVGRLVAFGGVEYGDRGPERATDDSHQIAVSADAPHSADDADSFLRGSWAGRFSALPGTAVEARGIAGTFTARFGADAPLEIVEGAAASRERLLALASGARWLHIATHGWFAPESIPSWADSKPLDEKSGLGQRLSGEEQVKGMSPMLLCGLALAGANRGPDALGRTPGLVTADELASLDLSNCDLVVLSACDTNLGQIRAGQGVASLQKALQMAGARSVITSLWKVPDAATKELMLEFYRRLWFEGQPKWQALREAKRVLREARDEHGDPRYSVRDWAAWVLTGEP